MSSTRANSSGPSSERMIRSAASAAPTAAGHAGGGEQERARRDAQEVDHLVRAGDEAAAGGERLGERAHAQVDVGLDAEQLAAPGAARAEHAGAVRLVDHQPRAVAPGTARRSRGSGATSPSIENTPSTTTSTPPPSSAARSSIFSSLSSRLWRNGRSLARESRQPSRIEAWSAGVGDHRVAGRRGSCRACRRWPGGRW